MNGTSAPRAWTPALAPLVLASASERRSAILARAGFEFVVRPADVDEAPPPGLGPEQVAEALAARKARAIAGDVARGTIVGSDTLVVVGDQLLGKPEDAADAERILRQLSGRSHRVISGVALVHRPTGVEIVSHAVTHVTMRAWTDAERADYVKSGECFGKAGAYAIQETADRFVTRLEGSFDNVVGFPTEVFLELLPRFAAQVAATERRS